MSIEQNKAIVRRYWQIMNELDVDAVEEWYLIDRLGHLQAQGAFDDLARLAKQT